MGSRILSKRVYIAGPYSTDPEWCTALAIAFGDAVLSRGHFPYIPHLAHFWDRQCPRPYEDWMALDLKWLEVCDVLLRIPGESPGADREMAHAKSWGIPVVYSLGEIEENSGV
jgi:hypothetical protein